MLQMKSENVAQVQGKKGSRAHDGSNYDFTSVETKLGRRSN